MSKILFVVNDISSFYSHRLGIIEKVIDSGFDVSVAMPAEDNDIRCIAKTHPSIEIWNWDLKKGSLNPFFEAIAFWRLAKIIGKLRPNIVQTFTIKAVLYGTLISWALRIPNIFATITGVGSLLIPGKKQNIFVKSIIHFLYLLILNRASKVIFQNESDFDMFVQKKYVKKENAILIPGSGVAEDTYFKNPKIEVSRRILFPARMIKDKGLFELIDAFKRFAKINPEYHLILAGPLDPGNPSGVGQSELEGLIKGYDNISWLGRVNSMVELYQSCKLVCLPSYREGLSKALLEAASSECVIITSNVPGCRELVVEGKSGFLCEPQNSESLFNSFILANSSREKWNEMGKLSREIIIEKYTLSKIASLYTSLYIDCRTTK